MVQIAHLYMITGKIIVLPLQTSVAKWISVFNTPSRFFITFLPSKEQVCFNFVVAVKVHSDFGAQENKNCHCFHISLIYMPWSGVTGCIECWIFYLWIVFWMLRFKPIFASPLLIKRLFSSLLSAIRVVSSSYLWMLIPSSLDSSLGFM